MRSAHSATRVIKLGALCVALGVALVACAEPVAVPSLEAVRDERSLAVTSAWLQAASAAKQYIDRDWPEAVYPPVQFERWVEPERAPTELATCMNQILGRTVGVVTQAGFLELSPRPSTEPTWALPVAQQRCQLQLVPWSGLYPFGGPVEQEWVRHQLTVALPNCVRRWGAELVIPSLDSAVDASIYPTSTGVRLPPTQSVWLIAEVRRADAATAEQIRATCPDPGRALVQLGPAEIRPVEFGPSGDGRTGAHSEQVSP